MNFILCIENRNISNSNNNNDEVKITFRLNNERNRVKFRQSIRDFDWNSFVSSDMNDYVGNFSRNINNLYCSAFPIKSKHILMRKVINPWVTPELAELVKQKSTYFELLRLGEITKQENNFFKHKVKATIQKAKITYYNNLFSNIFGNMRFTWNILNSLMDR